MLDYALPCNYQQIMHGHVHINNVCCCSGSSNPQNTLTLRHYASILAATVAGVHEIVGFKCSPGRPT
jgi:hypothetical protein